MHTLCIHFRPMPNIELVSLLHGKCTDTCLVAVLAGEGIFIYASSHDCENGQKSCSSLFAE